MILEAKFTESNHELPCEASVAVVVNEGGGGADGFSPIATVTQTDSGAIITITDKNGTTTATITNGKDGADGYSPVKGTDYWTEADKAEMVSGVISALPVYNGEVV
jgi:hypothetical protein